MATAAVLKGRVTFSAVAVAFSAVACTATTFASDALMSSASCAFVGCGGDPIARHAAAGSQLAEEITWSFTTTVALQGWPHR